MECEICGKTRYIVHMGGDTPWACIRCWKRDLSPPEPNGEAEEKEEKPVPSAEAEKKRSKRRLRHCEACKQKRYTARHGDGTLELCAACWMTQTSVSTPKTLSRTRSKSKSRFDFLSEPMQRAIWDADLTTIAASCADNQPSSTKAKKGNECQKSAEQPPSAKVVSKLLRSASSPALRRKRNCSPACAHTHPLAPVPDPGQSRGMLRKQKGSHVSPESHAAPDQCAPTMRKPPEFHDSQTFKASVNKSLARESPQRPFVECANAHHVSTAGDTGSIASPKPGTPLRKSAPYVSTVNRAAFGKQLPDRNVATASNHETIGLKSSIANSLPHWAFGTPEMELRELEMLEIIGGKSVNLSGMTSKGPVRDSVVGLKRHGH